jgi:hypothetical protein
LLLLPVSSWPRGLKRDGSGGINNLACDTGSRRWERAYCAETKWQVPGYLQAKILWRLETNANFFG